MKNVPCDTSEKMKLSDIGEKFYTVKLIFTATKHITWTYLISTAEWLRLKILLWVTISGDLLY